ncbi:MAG TPA: hypothetical protein PL064_13415, partial [Thermogutta sp.]|nr:hypothetical protein [Thermogutta sp.]
RAQRTYWELQSLLEVLPQALRDVVQQLRNGTFDIHLDHRGLEPSVNRLVVGLMTSALFLGSALMLAHRVPPLLSDLPLLGGWLSENMGSISAPGFVGISLSAIWGWRLWRAIRRSGRSIDIDGDARSSFPAGDTRRAKNRGIIFGKSPGAGLNSCFAEPLAPLMNWTHRPWKAV